MIKYNKGKNLIYFLNEYLEGLGLAYLSLMFDFYNDAESKETKRNLEREIKLLTSKYNYDDISCFLNENAQGKYSRETSKLLMEHILENLIFSVKETVKRSAIIDNEVVKREKIEQIIIRIENDLQIGVLKEVIEDEKIRTLKFAIQKYKKAYYLYFAKQDYSSSEIEGRILLEEIKSFISLDKLLEAAKEYDIVGLEEFGKLKPTKYFFDVKTAAQSI